MATISILSYGNPSVTQTLANSNAPKISIVNRTKCSPAAQLKTNNNNNNMEKANLNIKPGTKRPYTVMANNNNNNSAKKQKTLPLFETNTNIISAKPMIITVPANSAAAQRSAKLAKTLKRPLPEIDTTIMCRASGGKSKVFPLPLAVARRNARERNRVKQVNNGFSALRDRIPEEVAEAFEAQGNGRGSIKKLSKVETLRMAVEYIRSLERLLEINPNDSSEKSSDFQLSNESYQLSDTSSVMSALTPPPSDNISSGSFDDCDGLPDITIIEGHQYIRIPGTNTYQLLETTMTDDSTIIYENDENIEPIMAHQPMQQHMMQPSPPIDDYSNANDSINCYNDVYNNQTHILTPASISPGAYSMQSSSPALHDVNAANVQRSQPIEQSFLTATANKNVIRLPSLNNSALYAESLTVGLPINSQYEGILTLQTNVKQEIDEFNDDQPLSEESMMEAMHWWNSQQSTDEIVNDS